MIDEKYKDYATECQKLYIDAVNKHGSSVPAAKELGVNRSTVTKAIRTVKAKAARQGYSPEHGMHRAVPDGFVVKGILTRYKEDGSLASMSVRSAIDPVDQMEIIRSTIDTLVQKIEGKSRIIKSPKAVNTDLMCVYPFGDPHFGLHAWGKECGEDFDLKEARRVTLGAVDRLVERAPSSELAIILPLGDNLHVDDQTNRTPGHGHQLDADSRFMHIMMVCVETFKRAIERALEKHKFVLVRFVRGNHDPMANIALTLAVAGFYSNNPRVKIDLSPAAHWYYKFGKVLIGATHGDMSKLIQLPGVMSVDQAANWGLTLYRYWLTGHVHHSSVKEYPGCVVETFRTLAAADAYAAGHGYRAGRDMRCLVYHKDFGEIERFTCDVAMIK